MLVRVLTILFLLRVRTRLISCGVIFRCKFLGWEKIRGVSWCQMKIWQMEAFGEDFCLVQTISTSNWESQSVISLSYKGRHKKTVLFGTIVPNLWTHPPTPGLLEIWVIYCEFTGNFRQKRGQICHKKLWFIKVWVHPTPPTFSTIVPNKTIEWNGWRQQLVIMVVNG